MTNSLSIPTILPLTTSPSWKVFRLSSYKVLELLLPLDGTHGLLDGRLLSYGLPDGLLLGLGFLFRFTHFLVVFFHLIVIPLKILVLITQVRPFLDERVTFKISGQAHVNLIHIKTFHLYQK